MDIYERGILIIAGTVWLVVNDHHGCLYSLCIIINKGAKGTVTTIYVHMAMRKKSFATSEEWKSYPLKKSILQKSTHHSTCPPFKPLTQSNIHTTHLFPLPNASQTCTQTPIHTYYNINDDAPLTLLRSEYSA